MPITNVKVIYSLRIHIALKKMGFKYITEMKNPHNSKYNCWIYEETPAFQEAFDKLMAKGVR